MKISFPQETFAQKWYCEWIVFMIAQSLAYHTWYEYLYTELSKILSWNIYMTTGFPQYTGCIINIMQFYSWYILKDFCIA